MTKDKTKTIAGGFGGSWSGGHHKSWDWNCGKPSHTKNPPSGGGSPKPTPVTHTPSPKPDKPVKHRDRPDHDAKHIDHSGRPNLICALPFPWAQNHCDKKQRYGQEAASR